MSQHPPLVLLHGVNSTGAALEPFAGAFCWPGKVLCPDLLGHAGRPVPARFSVAELARDIVLTLDANAIERAVVGGHSFGGYLALYLARHWPQRCSAVFTLATKFTHDPETIRRWILLASPGRFNNTRVEQLTRCHAPEDWQRVLRGIQDLFADMQANAPLSEEDLQAIRVPILVASGQRDPLVSPQETEALARRIPGARLCMFPGSAHPLEAAPLLASQAIRHWATGLAATPAAAPAAADATVA